MISVNIIKKYSIYDRDNRRVNVVVMVIIWQNSYTKSQMVVNSFDLVIGFGAAVPYTELAQKAMSWHFKCLKDGVAVQFKHNYELLG